MQIMNSGLKCFFAGLVLSLPMTTTAFANDLADLVILRKQSTIEFVGCEKGQPLLKGSIAVKNIGDKTATWLPTRLMLGIFVQEAPDIRKETRWLGALSPNEIQSKEFNIGKGIHKKGRGITNTLRLRVPKNETVQRALIAEGLYRGAIDGKLGAQSYNAMIKYLETQLKIKINDKNKFNLSTERKIRLVNESGIKTTAADYKKAPDIIQRPITVSVVIDPRNRVKESNENNNIEKWELPEINCQ